MLGLDPELVPKNALYVYHDRLLEHKSELFTLHQQRWNDPFNAELEVLLYDLTNTYFESDPHFPEAVEANHQFGYRRNKRSACVRVVIATGVTTAGFPLAYEVLSGNTQDKQTLKGFLKKIETLYGKAERIWLMDRGIPKEEVPAEMREAAPPVRWFLSFEGRSYVKYSSESCNPSYVPSSLEECPLKNCGKSALDLHRSNKVSRLSKGTFSFDRYFIIFLRESKPIYSLAFWLTHTT